MWGTLVWKVMGSTLILPRLSASMPTVSVRGWPHCRWPCGIEQDFRTHHAAVGKDNLHAIGLHRNILQRAAPANGRARSRIWWMKSSTSSRSTNSRMVSRGSISVTGTSRAEKIVAYSTPTTPPPMTVRVRGSALFRGFRRCRKCASGRKEWCLAGAAACPPKSAHW